MADVGVWRRNPGDERSGVPGTSGGAAGLAELLTVALAALADGTAARGGPLPSGGPPAVTAAVRAALHGNVLPEAGAGAAGTLAELTRVFAWGAADPADQRCAGHLHCPPLAVAAAADFVASVFNQSLDSWDQGPAGIALEGEVIATLAGLAGYPPASAAGVLTTGGTESNLMGLLLAIRAAERKRSGGRLRVLCSELAHFSIARQAALLGLGENAVIRVVADRDHRMDVGALAEALGRAEARGEVPAAVVATAGTTDFGSIDPLPRVAEAALAHEAWLHVDAAYGGAALFSGRLAPLLRGLPSADSIALDLHKLGWQPVAAGVFLTRDATALEPLAENIAYLNPADDEAAGYLSLLGRSLRTTRRADAFKIAVTLRSLGRAGLGALVERCHDLARYAAQAIDEHPRLILEAPPVLTSVVFAYRAGREADRVNAALRRRLLAEGCAVVGRTEVSGGVRLKLTFLNPAASPADVDALLDAVVAAGLKEEEAC
jgi:L-2,4-diaminobutyrate decarboxylase